MGRVRAGETTREQGEGEKTKLVDVKEADFVHTMWSLQSDLRGARLER